MKHNKKMVLDFEESKKHRMILDLCKDLHMDYTIVQKRVDSVLSFNSRMGYNEIREYVILYGIMNRMGVSKK